MKSFELELNLRAEIQFDSEEKPIPEVEIIKENGLYVANNIEIPSEKYTFNTKEDLYFGIGSPARRPHQFRDLTGEDLFKGR